MGRVAVQRPPVIASVPVAGRHRVARRHTSPSHHHPRFAMPFVAVCPQCRNSRFRAPSSKRGEVVVCPKCGADVPLEPAEAPAPAPAVAPADDGSPRIALPALASAALAVLLCQFPYGRAVGVSLAVAGGLLGWLTLLSLDRHRWRGWVGVGVNAVVLVLLLAVPGSLGLSGWKGRAAVEPAENLGDATPEWVDAGGAAWELDGVRVALTFATIRADPAATGPARDEKHLWIGARVPNVGGRPFDFVGWDPTAGDRPTLTAAGGTPLPARPLGGTIAKATLKPNDTAECVLVFAPPANTTDDLLLELPPGPFGGPAPVRLRLPQKLVLRR